jgi:flagellin
VANNIGNAVSLLQTQDGALKVTGKILERLGELKTLNSDVTKNTTDRANYQTEFAALQTQLTNMASETFNGINLFGSSSMSVAVTEDGSTSTGVTLVGRDLASSTTGIGAITAGGTSTTLTSIAITSITAALENIATFRAANGA